MIGMWVDYCRPMKIEKPHRRAGICAFLFDQLGMHLPQK
jgi:hypothetical protein